MARRILQHGNIGNDQGINPEIGRLIYRVSPALETIRMGEGVECNMNFFIVVVHVIHRFFELFAAKIKAGKVASVGIIFETDINRIGTTINRCFQGRQISGRTEKFHSVRL
ncbi:Uncharacterised protein [Vibrio cholerae]|nr:Uncharacterised protein [Vibrio cholerae]CSC45731.1 Uncharacterised protein [Vibrio cholerae]